MTIKTLGSISLPEQNHKKEKQKEKQPLIHTPKSKHSTHRTQKNFVRNNRLIFLILLTAVGCAWIYYVPPINSFAIIPFILLVTGIFLIIVSHFHAKIRIFSTLFVFLFLIMNYMIGFDLINTIVLLSFIIGLSTLFREK